MGSIEKRRRRLPDGTLGNTSWRARYRDVNGRTRSRTFARRIDAERFLEVNGTDMQRGEWTDPGLRRTFFSKWANAWWATTVKLRPNTRRGYWLLLQNHVLPYFGTARLGGIDYLDVERFIAEKLKGGHGPKQVREMVTVLSLIMKCAVKASARRDNPAAGHGIQVPYHRVRQVPMLTMEQATRLVEQTSDHYKPAMWLLFFTGIRPAELCGLRVEDADLVRRVVHVRQTWSPIPAFDGGAREYVGRPGEVRRRATHHPDPGLALRRTGGPPGTPRTPRTSRPADRQQAGPPGQPRHLPGTRGTSGSSGCRPTRGVPHLRHPPHSCEPPD